VPIEENEAEEHAARIDDVLQELRRNMDDLTELVKLATDRASEIVAKSRKARPRGVRRSKKR
jgi:hypothetical protein